MRRLPLLLLLLAPLAHADDLFDGKTLGGWVAEGGKTYKDGGKNAPVWSVRDGMICCDATSGFGFLRHERKVKDFVLSLDYRFPAPAKGKRGNSGVGVRTCVFDPKESTKTRPSVYSYEIQLLDDADKKPDRHSTGSLYRYVAPSEQAVRPAPEWNTMEVECVGPRIKITLNGKKIIDVDQTKIKDLRDKPLEGHVCLQNHGSKIDFRNIKLRDLTGK
ncbi:MAG: 3-keto-disaccharide hydrolase [Gemmataceae bacterium]